MPNRVRGRPFTRWDDKVTKFSWMHFGQSWQDVPYARFSEGYNAFMNESTSEQHSLIMSEIPSIPLISRVVPHNVSVSRRSARYHEVHVPFFHPSNDNWW